MSKSKTVSKILRVKDSRKKELEIEAKKAGDRVDAEQAKLSILEEEYANTLKSFDCKHAEGSLEAQDISSFYNYFANLNSMIAVQRENLTQRINEFSFIQKSLLDAHRDKKLFEIFNDKIVKKENKDKMLVEQKENDYLSISKRLR